MEDTRLSGETELIKSLIRDSSLALPHELKQRDTKNLYALEDVYRTQNFIAWLNTQFELSFHRQCLYGNLHRYKLTHIVPFSDFGSMILNRLSFRQRAAGKLWPIRAEADYQNIAKSVSRHGSRADRA